MIITMISKFHASRVSLTPRWWFSFTGIGLILSQLCTGGHVELYSGSVIYVSDLGNQHNNGPHQDQTFDNPYALCLALWAKNQIQLGRGETDAPNRLFLKEVELFFSSCVLFWHQIYFV